MKLYSFLLIIITLIALSCDQNADKNKAEGSEATPSVKLINFNRDSYSAYIKDQLMEVSTPQIDSITTIMNLFYKNRDSLVLINKWGGPDNKTTRTLAVQKRNKDIRMLLGKENFVKWASIQKSWGATLDDSSE